MHSSAKCGLKIARSLFVRLSVSLSVCDVGGSLTAWVENLETSPKVIHLLPGNMEKFWGENVRSTPTLSPVSTGMGDRLRTGVPPRYVTKPTTRQLSLASLRGR